MMTTGGTRIVLTEEEELMFNYYFKNVRPTQLQKDGKMVKAFFLSSKGNLVANPSNDINRLQKYNFLPVTGKIAKQAFNKWAEENLGTEDIEMAYGYINQDLASQSDEMTIIKGMLVITNLEQISGPSTKKRRVEHQEAEGETEEDGEEEERDVPVELKEESYQKFLQLHPLDLNGPLPSLNMCKQANERKCAVLPGQVETGPE
ncbi:uncharacterized protein [Engystomops pustulosus]|uniref:uncharacterized protein n=1 Tax=Engystomops pustulosus TaxID=76066 RepID=UPI003AFB69A3